MLGLGSGHGLRGSAVLLITNAVSLLLLYVVVRFGVRHGLADHEERLRTGFFAKGREDPPEYRDDVFDDPDD